MAKIQAPKIATLLLTYDQTRNENFPMYVGDANEIEAILHGNGFADVDIGKGRVGVYIVDIPGEPNPDYPFDQVLEITLPVEINLDNWRSVVKIPEKPCLWHEWLIPAKILNKHARMRLLTKDQWVQTWATYKQSVTGQKEKTPDPEIVQQNAKAFEALAMKWMDSRTGKPANTKRRTAVVGAPTYGGHISLPSAPNQCRSPTRAWSDEDAVNRPLKH